MQGPTHRSGGVTAALAGYIWASQSGSPLVVAAPLASFLVIYPFAIWGSSASDLDHSPGSLWSELKLVGTREGHTIPFQDPISRGISHLLHATKKIRRLVPRKTLSHKLLGICDAKHRSWQTHSELTALILFWAISRVPNPTDLSSAIMQLVLSGVFLGLLAHLVLDLLTPEGLPLALGMLFNKFIFRRRVFPEKIKLVPHVPPSKEGEPGFFSTGGAWEKKVVYNLLHAVNLFLLGFLVWENAGLKYIILPYMGF